MGLTQERLKELLSYDPLTGVFLWKVNRRGRFAKAGAIAGYPDQKDGYLCICVDQRQYRLHRLAWFYMTGEWPSEQIDHIDLDKTNNRFANLREATHRQNQHNRPKRGYTFDKRRNAFVAQIRIDGKHKYLGQFNTAAEATAAYNEAAQIYHGEFARAA